MKNQLIFFVFVFLWLSPAIFADPYQSVSPGSSPQTGSTASGFGEPYTEKEFPKWMLELRRGESLFFGSFPLFFIFSGLGYDYYYYYAVSGQNPNYMPWPAGPGTSGWTTTSNASQLSDKTKTLMLVSATASLLLALTDWLLGKLTE